MTQKLLHCSAFAALLALTYACYRWPSADLAAFVLGPIVIALANNIFGARSLRKGVAAGIVAAILSAAACVGREMSFDAGLIVTTILACMAFIFASTPMKGRWKIVPRGSEINTLTFEDSGNHPRDEAFESGEGGDFCGGGASGSFEESTQEEQS